MRRLVVLLSLFALVGFLPEAQAQGHLEKYDAKTVATNVKKVIKGYRWLESLEAAKAEAKEKHKMIFYLQMVGDIDGGL